jgi:hypothetical protein
LEKSEIVAAGPEVSVAGTGQDASKRAVRKHKQEKDCCKVFKDSGYHKIQLNLIEIAQEFNKEYLIYKNKEIEMKQK